jgi:penicillin-binding protein A
MYMGVVDDITAMKKSSNTYQFNTAINVGKGKYSYNKPLVIDKNAFNLYRSTFSRIWTRSKHRDRFTKRKHWLQR